MGDITRIKADLNFPQLHYAAYTSDVTLYVKFLLNNEVESRYFHVARACTCSPESEGLRTVTFA